MENAKHRLITMAAIAGLAASVGDFLVTISLGFFYPGYNHLKLVVRSDRTLFEKEVSSA